MLLVVVAAVNDKMMMYDALCRLFGLYVCMYVCIISINKIIHSTLFRSFVLLLLKWLAVFFRFPYDVAGTYRCWNDDGSLMRRHNDDENAMLLGIL